MTSRQIAMTGRLVDASHAGDWAVYARVRGGPLTNLSVFRGTPVAVGDFTMEDPFGPKDLSLTFTNVSYFERRGFGDLAWASKKTSLDLVWKGALPTAYPFGASTGPRAAPTFVPWFGWEGYIEDFTYDENGALTVLGKGGLYQLDNYNAKPELPHQPLPYEYAIARQFHSRPHLRLTKLLVDWPTWWGDTYATGGWVDKYTVFPAPSKNTQSYLIPAGVYPGDKWTGMVTRDTGNWEPVLSSYITRLLQGMYTAHGRWTLDLLRGRVPVLTHRTINLYADNSTVVLDLTHPDINPSGLSENASQSLDVIFGSGVSLAGVSYSGEQVSNDGASTYYEPLVASRQAWPVKDNDWLDLTDMPREVKLELPDGLDEHQAEQVARAHYARFANPGVTVDVTVSTDLRLGDGSVLPWPLVRPGMKAELRGLYGMVPGPVGHVTATRVSLAAKQAVISVDTKWRDALTAAEAKARGRDTLNIPRMLVAGQYTPPLPDQLLPWDYSQGSGQIPYRPDTREFFDRMPNDLRFPWTPFTTTHKPSDARWRDAYIRIDPVNVDFDRNWAGFAKHPAKNYHHSVPIRMAQQGAVRLLQVAAYNADGTIAAVPFHISIYYMKGTTVAAMPKVGPPYSTVGDPKFITGWDTHVGQRTPWVPDAWEEYNTDGTLKSTEVPAPVRSAGLWHAWGNSAVKAGYFPGDGSGSPTGMLVDETNYPFDTSQYGQFDIHAAIGSPLQNSVKKEQGMMYVMIYCDAQATAPVYFLGRMFRAEPGSSIGSS